MSGRLIPRRFLVLVAAVTVVLVLSLTAVLAFAAILGAMGDNAGSAVLRWVAAGVGIALAVDLMCMVLALALYVVERPDEPPEESQ